MLVLVAPRKDDFSSQTSAIESSIGTLARAVEAHSSNAWRVQIGAIVATRSGCNSIEHCPAAGSFRVAGLAHV